MAWGNTKRMSYCKKCKGKVVMHAFSEGTCEVCEENISCGHTPCDLVCQNCAEDFNLCESCGGKL